MELTKKILCYGQLSLSLFFFLATMEILASISP